MDERCPFCDPDPSRVFHRGAAVLGLWDSFPVSPGHALLVPKRHVATWFEASDEERRELADAVSVAREAILREHRPDGFNLGVNVGEVAGQTVFHLHVHVIPRYAGDVAAARGGVRGVIPGRRAFPAADDGSIASDAPAAYGATTLPAISPAAEPELDEATFAEKVLNLLDRGVFATTYKHAVLLGLIELCLERADARGRAPARLHTRELAQKIVAIYWPHAVPFEGRDVLRQSSTGQAEIVTAIRRFRERSAPDASTPLARAARAAPERFDALLRTVEFKLIEMPLPRLQNVSGSHQPFLYRVNWNEREVASQAALATLDRTIHLRPGAGDHLVRLSALLRPLIQRQWIRMITGIRSNAGLVVDAGLEDFLFGADRIVLDPVRPGLRELQNDRCFFCESRLGAAAHVDHFVPWARYPSNAIENLVVAHPDCNVQKKDFLAASPHVARWTARRRAHGADLRAIAMQAVWESTGDVPFNVARGIYLSLRGDVPLWLRARDFVPPDRATLEAALAG